MRWDALFRDLEAQLEAAAELRLESDIAELARLEQSAQPLADRLRASRGQVLSVRTADGTVRRGTLSELGADWIVLQAAPREVLISMAAVQTIEGLNRRSEPETSEGRRRLGLGTVLRALSQERARVQVEVRGLPPLSGWIDRVGRDYFELLPVPADSFSPARAPVQAVPFTALVAVASLH